MSIPHTRKGRHAAPARPTRRLAVAAALAAGAPPLVCGGTAVAATTETVTTTLTPQADLPELGLPAMALPLGTVNSGVAPQVTGLADGLIGQARPLASQLQRNGVPTVGDVTARLSTTELPVVGTVGSLTQTLPVTTVLGAQSPVTGALQSLSGV